MSSPAFFIVGVGRSGTTLARAIITGHPRLDVPPETGFLPLLIRLRPLWYAGGKMRPNVFTRLAFANGRLSRAGLERRDILATLHAKSPSTPQDAISRLYDAYASQHNIQVGDKTPGYCESIDLLGRVFPEAQFIHMVRHPLDVVASLLRQPWGPNDPLAAAALWLRGVRSCINADIQPARLLVVRLEDLIAEPNTTVGAIAEHLGVDMHPKMLEFSARAGRISQENFHPNSHTGLAEPLSSTRHWDQDLRRKDALRVWALVAPTAERFGYHGPEGPLPRVSETGARMRLKLFNLTRGWRRARTLAGLIRA